MSQVGSHPRTDTESTQLLANALGMMGWISREKKVLKFLLLRAA